MHPQNTIFEIIKQKQIVTSKELASHLGVSRQAIHKHLKQLIQNNLILKEGSTRGASYRLLKAGETQIPLRINRTFAIQGLEEDIVFRELSAIFNLERRLNKNAFDITQHAFTEMLNNAIDHSGSEKCEVDAHPDPYAFNFRIRDFGIGNFYSIFEKFKLSDEYAAIGELLKGKTTTMQKTMQGKVFSLLQKLRTYYHLDLTKRN